MRLAAALVSTVLALPAAASASTVSLDPGGNDDPPIVEYKAAAGEQNKLDVKVTNATAEISDPGAGSITPGINCTSVNPKKVTCTNPEGQRILDLYAELLDGADTFDVSGVNSNVHGGTGNDTLRGGEQRDVLNGGTGTDTMQGNASSDILLDGDTSGSANKDTYEGGEGEDFAEYRGRTVSVKVDLAAPGSAGEPGENDVLVSIESAIGGDGNDEIRGTDGENHVAGGKGDDLVEGRGGADRVYGGEGGDTVSGGDGRDDIEAETGNDTLRLDNPPGVHDRLVVCGPGKDTVVGVGVAPSLSFDCEVGDFGFGFVNNLWPKKVTREKVTLKVACPEAYRKDGVCKGSIVVEPKAAYSKSPAQRKAQRLGSAKFAIAGASKKITIALNSRGRRELRKSAFKLQFTIRLKETATGTKREFAWTNYLVRQFL